MAPVARPWLPGHSAIGALLLLGACGDPIYDQSYRGQVFYTESRTITWSLEGPGDPTDLRLALFFNPGLPGAVDVDNWIELGASITPITALPTHIDFNIFALPTDEMLAHAADGTPLGYGTAHQLAYRDSNHDGRRSLDEPFLGPLMTWQFMYLPEPLAASQLPIDRDLPAGFFRVFTPQTCGQALPGATTPGDCGVPLGAKCASDLDCAGGYCLTQTKISWRGGYCVVQEPPKNGCRPAAGVYYRRPQVTQIPKGVVGYYLRACVQDADCHSPTDGSRNLFSCDRGLGACTPTDTLNAQVGTTLAPTSIEPFCGSGIFVPKP